MFNGQAAFRTAEFRSQKSQVKLEWPSLVRVFSHFLPHWRPSIAVLGCITTTSLLGLVPAQATRVLIDRALTPGGGFATIVLVGGLWLLSGLVSGLVGVLESYLTSRISQAIMADLRKRLFSNLLGQSVAFYTKTRSGEVTSRIVSDVAAVQGVVSDTIFSLISNLVIISVTLGFMFSVDWRLALVSIAILPLLTLPTQRVGDANFRAVKNVQAKTAEINGYLGEILGISGMLLVTAFGRPQSETARFSKLVDELGALSVSRQMIGRWFFMVLQLLFTSGPVLIIVVGGWFVIHGSVTAGTVVAFATQLLPRLFGPVSQLASTHVNVVGSLALFQRIYEYIDMPADVVERAAARPLREVRGEVAFDNVSFSYTQHEPALRAVSLRVPPGRLTAVVGPSGAGKTTLTSLVARLYDPTEGVVTLDGEDVRELTLQSLRDSIGIVFQDTFLLHASVRENLLYARPDASSAELEAACRAAHIDELIASLPDGFETVVGERGHRLSGGERQRLAIARVILKDPRILILDEATSSLDSESEHLIQSALAVLFQNRTAIVIAHRLSTVLAADQIAVLDRGAIVGVGKHAELLAAGGVYAQLYERQFAADRSVPEVMPA